MWTTFTETQYLIINRTVSFSDATYVEALRGNVAGGQYQCNLTQGRTIQIDQAYNPLIDFSSCSLINGGFSAGGLSFTYNLDTLYSLSGYNGRCQVFYGFLGSSPSPPLISHPLSVGGRVFIRLGDPDCELGVTCNAVSLTSNCDATLGSSGNIDLSPLSFTFIDPDGVDNTELSFQFDSGNEENYFSLDSMTAGISLIQSIDRDIGPKSFLLVVSLTDGMFSSTYNVSVAVLDINDNQPEPPQPSLIFSISEGLPPSTFIQNVVFSDGDDGNNSQLTYSLEGSDNNFIIDAGTGEVVTNREFDYEAGDSSFTFTVTATDGGSPPQSGTVGMTVNIQDENDNRPEISATLVAGAMYIEQGSSVRIADVNVMDSDASFNLHFAKVTIINALDVNETISAAVPSGLKRGFSNYSLYIAGNISPTQMATILQSSHYINLAEELSPPLNRTIEYSVCDQFINSNIIASLTQDTQHALMYGNASDLSLPPSDIEIISTACQQLVSVSVELPLTAVNDRPEILFDTVEFASIPENITDEENKGEFIVLAFQGSIADTDPSSFIGVAIIGHGSPATPQQGTITTSTYCRDLHMEAAGCDGVDTHPLELYDIGACSETTAFYQFYFVFKPAMDPLNIDVVKCNNNNDDDRRRRKNEETIDFSQVVSVELVLGTGYRFDITPIYVEEDNYTLTLTGIGGHNLAAFCQGNGSYYITLNDSTTVFLPLISVYVEYTDITVVSETSAVVLGPYNIIRFVPHPYEFGIAWLEFKAWDGTDGFPPGTSGIDTTLSESFSIDTGNATIEITPVNNPPEIELGGPGVTNFSTTYTENGPNAFVTSTEAQIIERDPGDVFLNSLSISITNEEGACDLPNFSGISQDRLSYYNETLIPMSISMNTSGEACTTYVFDSTTFTIDQWKSYIQMIRFFVTNDEPSDHLRRLEFVISDDLTTSLPSYTFISVSLVSDHCPQLNLSNRIPPIMYTEHSSPVLIDSSLQITDGDRNPSIQMVTVSLTRMQGVCSSCILNSSVSDPEISEMFNNDTKVLTLQGPADPSAFQTVLRGVQFEDRGSEPRASSIIVSVRVFDPTLTCSDATDNILIVIEDINDNSPIIYLDWPSVNQNYTTSFIEDEGDGSIRAAGNVFIVEPDFGESVSYIISVQIEECMSIEDMLEFIAPGATTISVAYNQSKCSLELSGNITNLQNDLNLLRYRNTKQDDPTPGLRTIKFTIDDPGVPATSSFTFVTVTAINDKPRVILNTNVNSPDRMFQVELGTAVVAITGDDNSGAIFDPDSTFLESMILRLSIFDSSNEELDPFSMNEIQLADNSILTAFNLVANYSASVVLISGTASVSEYTTVLNNIVYENTQQPPTDYRREISVTVNDGEAESEPVTATITYVGVLDSPIVDLNGNEAGRDITRTYTFTTEAIQLFPDGTITDPSDNTICKLQATLVGDNDTCPSNSITFRTGFMDIEVDEQNSGDITVYTLTTTFTECRENIIFQRILQDVMFQSDGSIAGNCTLSIVASDVTTLNSTAAVATIQVRAYNQPPFIDLDLGLGGREDTNYSTPYFQGGAIKHIVSIFNANTSHNITTMTVIGEADGEAATDGTIYAGVVIDEQSDAGYLVEDGDSDTLTYLQTEFIIATNPDNDVIRYPCKPNTATHPQGCNSPGQITTISDLSCDDTVFDACSNPDLCPNLAVTIFCVSPNEAYPSGTKAYRFVYLTNGTVERYETLLGYLGYEYLLTEGGDLNQIRVIKVTVSDGENVNSPAFTRIKILTPGLQILIEPPPPEPTFIVYEDERPHRTVSVYTIPVQRLDGTIPDPGTVEFSIIEGNTGNAFRIDSTTGQIYLNNMVDREIIPSYTLTVTAHIIGTDEETTVQAQLIAQVIDINDKHPMTDFDSYTANVSEGMADITVVHVIATDDDEGTNAELSYILLGIGVENFMVANGTVTTKVALNASITDYYLLVMIISDRGTPSLGAHVVIHINVITPPPTNLSFVDSTIQPISVFEDIAVGIEFHTVEAVEVGVTEDTSALIQYEILSIMPQENPQPFDIDMVTGVLRISSSLDSERNSRYEIILRSYSIRRFSPPSPDIATLVVSVNDINEDEPMFPGTPLNFSVAENSANDAEVGRVSTTDPDSMNTGITYFLHPSSPSDLPFTVESNGSILVSGTIDYEEDISFTFTVQAEDEPAHGATSRTGTAQVRVMVTDRNDNPPRFENTPYTATVFETASNGYEVFAFTTTDIDSPDNQNVSFSSTDIGVTPFCLVSSFIQVCDPAQLTGIEAPTTFYITIVATNEPFLPSDDIQTASATATINLTLINEFEPVFTNNNVILPQFMEEHCGRGNGSSCVGFKLYDFNATDSDGDEITYRLITDNVNFTVITNTAELIVTGRIDREQIDSYFLQVEAVDSPDINGRVRSSTANITVTVADIDDNAPIISPPLEFYVTENMTTTMTTFGSINIIDPDITGSHEFQIDAAQSETQSGCVTPPRVSRDDPQYLPIQIDMVTGELFFCQQVDFEADRRVFVFTTVVVDEGQLDNSTSVVYVTRASITVRIVDFNDNPPVIEGDPHTFSVAENRPSSTTVGNVTATDSDSGVFGDLSFSLSYNGSTSCSTDLPFVITKVNNTTANIQTCLELNYEDQSSYNFYLVVCDGATPVPMCDASLVTVNVVDQNDNPPIFILQLYTAEIEETDTSLNDTFVVKVVVSDEDAAQNSISQFSITTNGSPFNFRQETDLTSDLYVAQPSLIDYDIGIRNYTITVLALNMPFDPTDESQNATTTVFVTIADVNDNAPIIRPPYEFEVRELQPPETEVGCVSATDADDGSNALLSFYISDAMGYVSCTPTIPFQINVTTGCITTCELLDYGIATLYDFTITVCDNGSTMLCSNRSIRIEITDLNNNPLIFTEDPFVRDINENLPSLETIFTITSTDADSDANSNVTYSFVNTTAPFAIRNEAEVYYTGDEPLNYETGPLAHILNVRGINPPAIQGDMEWTVDVVVTFNIVDRNDNPPVFLPDMDTITIEEHPAVANGDILYTLETSDEDTDPNSDVVFTILNSSPFTITGENVTVADSVAVDFDPPNGETQYILTIQATNYPAASDDIPQTSNFSLTVNVRDINDNAPQCGNLDSFNVPEDAEILIPIRRYVANDIDSGENGVAGLKYYLDGNGFMGSGSGSGIGSGDPVCSFDDPFRIYTDSGNIYLCVPLDYEITTYYNVIVTVCDPDVCTQCPLQVFILDVNDNAPVFNPPMEFSIMETAPISTEVGCINGTDIDTGDNGKISYSILETECVENTPFQINSTTGCITVCQNLDFERQISYEFTVILDDNSFNDSAVVTVYIENENDHTPVITSVSVAEVNEEESNAFVINVTAEDIDAAPFNSIVFRLTDDAGGRFAINSTTGVVTTTSALDRESISSYRVVVNVSDGTLSSEQNLTIYLTDINDNPPIYEGNDTYYFFEEIETVQVVLIFSDEDIPINSNHTYSVSHPLFVVSTTGILTSTQFLDRDPATGGQPNITVAINVTDGENSVQVLILIALRDINDNAPIPMPPFGADIIDGTVSDSPVLTIIATDADEGDNARLIYTLDGSSDIFNVDSSTGVVTVRRNITLDINMPQEFFVSINISDSALDRQVITQLYTFTVISDVPRFPQAMYQFNADENNFMSLINSIRAMDRDTDFANDVFEYRILDVIPYNSGFTINSINDTGYIYSPPQYFDFEDSAQFILTIAVQRTNTTTIDDITTVLVTVVDSNDNRPWLSPLNIIAELPENSVSGTTIATAVGIDFDRGLNGMFSYNHSGLRAEAFEFDSGGNFKVANSIFLDFETYMNFTFDYQACDGGINQLCSEVGQIFISITNVDDLPPVFIDNLYTEIISEDFAPNRLILTVSFTDRDTPITDVQLYLSPEQTLFEIVQISGALMTTDIPLDHETLNIHSFVVIANDTSGQMDTASIVIHISDVDDVRPRVNPIQSIASFSESGGASLIASSLSIEDGDSIDAFPLSKIEITLHPSPNSIEGYPLDGGICNHANYSIFYEENVYSLCGISPTCIYLLNPNDIVIQGFAVLADKILTIPPMSLVRNRLQFPQSDLQSFSFSAWVRLDAPTTSGDIFQLRTSLDIEIQLRVTAPVDGTDMGSLTILSREQDVYTTTKLSTHDGKWHQVVLVRNQDTFTIYFDASIVAHENLTGFNNIYTSDATVFLGVELECQMAEVYICLHDISQETVQCTMTCGESFDVQSSTDNVTASVDLRTRSLTLVYTGDSPTASIVQLERALKKLQFISSEQIEEPHPLSRGVFISISDTVGPPDEHGVITLTPNLINDQRPVLDLNGFDEDGVNFTVIFNELSLGVSIIDEDAVLYDEDSGFFTMSRIEIEILSPTTVEQLFVNRNVSGLTITQESSFLVVIQSSTSLEHYPGVFLDALRGVIYRDLQDEPVQTERNIQFTVYDMGGNFVNDPLSITTVTVLPTNDIPVLDLDTLSSATNNASVTYSEESGQVTLLSGLSQSINDPDSTLISRAIIEFTVRPDGESERLQLITSDPVTSSFDSENGTLLIIGTHDFETWLNILRGIEYINTFGRPDETIIREVSIQIEDDSGGRSEAVYVTISITLFNDPPEVFLGGPGVTNFDTEFEEEGPCVPIASTNMVLIDIDSPQLFYVQVRFLFNLDPDNEYINVTQDPPGLYSFNIRTPIIRLTNTTPENYQLALPNIAYCNTADEPGVGERRVEVIAIDAGVPYSGGTLRNKRSNPAYTNITITRVNDQPLLEIQQLNNVSIRGVPTPIIDPDSIVLEDSDDSFFSSLYIFITNDEDGEGNEIIEFAALLQTGTTSIGPLPAAGGEFFYNVTFRDAVADTDQVKNTIAIIRYNNRATNITVNPPRIICIQVADAKGLFSERVCVNVTISPPNDATPLFLNVSSSLVFSYNERESPIAIGKLVATDADTGLSGLIAYSIGQVLSTPEGGSAEVTTTLDIFQIDETSGDVSAPQGLDAEDYTQHVVTVIAEDMGNPVLSSEVIITITITDLNDRAPVFLGAPYIIDPGPLEGLTTQIIGTVQATDLDATSENNQIIRYFLQPENPTFSINSASGEIRSEEPLDADTKPQFNLTVGAEDSGTPPQTAYTTVVFEVRDINDNAATVNQIAPAIYMINDPATQQSIGPAIRISDQDLNSASTAISRVEVLLTLGLEEQQREYTTCLTICQPTRIINAGLTNSFDLFENATFMTDNNSPDGLQFIEKGDGNCNFVRLSRGNLVNDHSDDGYGRIPRSTLPSDFASGDFSVSFVLTIQNEGYVLVVPNTENIALQTQDVEREFGIWVRRRDFRFYYTYGESRTYQIIDYDLSNDQFFDPNGAFDDAITRHFTAVVRSSSQEFVLYIDCREVYRTRLDGVVVPPDDNIDVFIGQSRPSATVGGRLGGDIHGLYYHPVALSTSEVVEFCSCGLESLLPPANFPSTIVPAEPTFIISNNPAVIPSNVTLEFRPPTDISFIPEEDITNALRETTYINTYSYNSVTSIPDRFLQFIVNEVAGDQEGNGISSGRIKLVTGGMFNEPPVIYLSGTAVSSGINYTTSFTEDDNSVNLLSQNVRITRVTPDNVPATYRQIEIEIINAVDTDEYIVASSDLSFITVQDNGAKVVIEGPGGSGDFIDVLQTVMYINTDENPTTSFNRMIEFKIIDTEGRVNSPVAVSTVVVNAVNDAPMLTISENGAETTRTVEYNEGSLSGVTLAPQVTILDVDNENIDFAEVMLASPNLTTDSLQLNSTPTGLHWNYDQGTGVLTITRNAHIMIYEQALRNITFMSNDSPFLDNAGEPIDPTDRIVTIRVNDAEAFSTPVTVTIAFQPVDDPPSVFGISNVIEYTDGDPPLQIAPNAIIQDDDNVRLKMLEVTLTTPIDGDILVYSVMPELPITFFEDSVVNLTRILQAITFVNNEPELDLIDRLIDIMVCDFTACSMTSITIVVRDANDNAPMFSSPSYSFNIDEDSPVGTVIDEIQVTDADDREIITTNFVYEISPTSVPIRLEPIGNRDRVQIIVDDVLDAETNTIYEFTVIVSDGTNTGNTTITLNVVNVNEVPTISLDSSSATIVGGPNSDTQLLQVGFSISDPDLGDSVDRARLTIRNLPAGSNETLNFSPETDGITFSAVMAITNQFELEITNGTALNDSLESQLQNIFYTAGSMVTETTVLRFVDVIVLDSEGLESEAITVNVSLASIPVFSNSIYELQLVEGILHMQFYQVEASVESGGDIIEYAVEQGRGVSIDDNGFLDLIRLLDREATPTLSFEVYAVDSLPPARTGTATVIITVLDDNDVRPNITANQSNITIYTGVSVVLLPSITVTDPDASSNIIHSNITIIGQRDIVASPFTGYVCIDEYRVIDKMVEVCGLLDFINVLEHNSTRSGVTQLEDEFGNHILTSTDEGYTVIEANLSSISSGGVVSELTTAFWVRAEESGYIIYIGGSNALERYWAIYYDQGLNQLIVTMKRVGLSYLQAQIRVIFQMESSLDDGNWHFVMIQYNNRDLLCVVDAVRVESMATVYKEKIYLNQVFGEFILFFHNSEFSNH